MSSSLHDLVKVQTVFSLCAVIVLFIPVWFYTTQVHRATLPVEAVRSLLVPTELRFTNRFYLDIQSEDGAHTNAKEIATSIESQLNSVFVDDTLAGFRFTIDVNDSASEDTSNGVYSLKVRCGTKSVKDEGSVLVDVERQLIIQTITSCADYQAISTQIIAAVGGLFVTEKKDFIAIKSEATTNDPASMRKIKFANEYQLMFNLLNADPQSLLTDWDIESAIKGMLFVNIMQKLYDIKITSQIQYFTTLAIQPDSVGNSNILYPNHLPHFINSAEWGFDGSSVSTSPPINFVIYVPTQTQTPLYIASLNEKNSPLVETNAFSIPQWGGIAIVNPDYTSNKIETSSQTLVKVYKLDAQELEGPMNVFLEQMRGLLGVKTVELGSAERLLPGFTFKYAGSSSGITKWELDRLTRFTTIKNIEDAISTLNSLVALIESMENMVVLDHIRDEITLSLKSIYKVQQILSSSNALSIDELGQNQYDVALAASRVAITAAERAFFDPTMVSLLYFPDEHKLAVYLPLFLPVLVPLFSTIVQEIKKKIQQRKDVKKAKTE
ncbi:UNVERIFIED_CONTAM: hypothetical protein HDU68_006274 [Siphonaria sp. JEL0065]|nr:hypothetical protein HDU68_006274 [Siphonaria sp. JEL0065]